MARKAHTNVPRIAQAALALGIAASMACSARPEPDGTSGFDRSAFTCLSPADCTPAAPLCALIDVPESPGSQITSACYSVQDGQSYFCITATQSQCVASVAASTCTSNADCPDPGAFCSGLEAGLASGVCSRACDDWDYAAPCGAGASCAIDAAASTQVCMPSCGQGGWCSYGFACDPNYDLYSGPAAEPAQGRAFGTTPSQWVCVPYCTTDAQCAGGDCNGYTHRCGSVDQRLQDDGAPCAVNTDCRSGQCETAGFLDGNCDSTCVQPDQSAYDSPTLPGADCPGSEVCAPDPAGGPNILSRCFPRCGTDADCRPDYVCVHPQRPGPGPRTLDGFCDALSDPLSTQ